MRKILITILTIGAIFSFSLKINAETAPLVSGSNTNLYSRYYAINMKWGIPEGTVYIELIIPIYAGLVMTQTGSGLKSYINFMDGSSVTIEDYDFEEIGGRMYGLFRFILSEYNAEGTLFFGVTFMHNYGVSLPSGLLPDMQTNVIVKANDTLRRVKYYTNSVLYQTSLFVDIPQVPSDPTPPSGYVFNGWVTGDGLPYNFTEISDDDLVDETFYLYADFVSETYTAPIPEPTTNVPQDLRNILALVRLDNVEGYGIFFVLVSIVLIGVSVLLLKLNALIIAVIELVWLGLSMYLGLITIWIGVVIALFIAVIILYRMKVDV